MTAVPLPQGITGIKDTPKLSEYLINLFSHEGYLLRTPGTKAEVVSSEVGCRANATWYVDSKPYFVIGSKLQRLEVGGTLTDLGTIAGSADCVFSLGQVNLVIIVKGGNGYTYNDDTGLVQITDPDFIPSNSVDFINGRHVFIPSDGEPAFYSEVDQAGNINPLNFFDAEELPDLNKFTINISNQLYIGGGQAFEMFRPTTNVLTPFLKRDNARIDVGYIGGGIRYLGTFAFIGNTRDQGYSINIMQSGQAPAISNSAINELLNTEYTSGQLKDANAFSFQWKGAQVIGWNIAPYTIAYIGGNWIYFDSSLDALTTGPWNGKYVTFAYNRYYVGHRTTGQIGSLTDTPGEYGAQVEYELCTFVRSTKNSYFSLRALEADLLTGQDDTTIGLSLGRDGVANDDFTYRNLLATGNYNHRIRWGGGLGTYESFCQIRMRGTGNVKLSMEALEADL